MAAGKFVFISLVIIFLNHSAAAQVKLMSLGGYAEAMLRADSAETKVSQGFGGGLDMELRIPVKLTGIASLGLVHFNEKKPDPVTTIPQLNVVILRTGLKYRIHFFYLKMEAGSAFPLKNGEYATILSPGAGFRFSAIDIQGKYEVWLGEQKEAFYGIKLGIHF